MKYTEWDKAPMVWHKIIKILIPLAILFSMYDLWAHYAFSIGLIYTYTDYWVFSVMLVLLFVAFWGALITAEVGLIRRKWFGPCALFIGVGTQIYFGLLSLLLRVMIHMLFSIRYGIGRILIGGILLTICIVYYKKRRLLFAPSPFTATSDSKRTRYAYAASESTGHAFAVPPPETIQQQKAAGGYRTIYREAEPENAAPEATGVKEPEATRDEPEDGVALLLQLQAEEEAKRAADGYPAMPEGPGEPSGPM